ncbi:MAG: putative porin, partial [Clostridium sp.]
MNRLSLKTKIITAVITGGLIVSSASFAFAADKVAPQTNVRGALKHNKGTATDRGVKLEGELKEAVTSKIITQVESDKILAYETSKAPKVPTGEKPEKTDLFVELVEENILTQEKADALKTSVEAKMKAQRQADLNTKINVFVTDKAITQEQATKVIAAINADKATKKAARDKASTMTETERKTYMDSLRDNEVGPLKALVTAKAITQA